MVAVAQNKTPAERFWPRVEKTETCWLWTGYVKPNGYAAFYPGGGRHVAKAYVHRWAWESANGPIPRGLEIDHLCNVRHCVNPAHLELVTRDENLARRDARVTHCLRGHEFTEATTYWHEGHRHCKPCRQITHAARRLGV